MIDQRSTNFRFHFKLKDMPNTISIEEAQRWVQRWRTSSEILELKGFWIPGADLTDVMAEEDVVDARTYMAIDDNDEFHLLIVGVDSAGNDLIDYDNGQYIYDFTKPCPSVCSNTGPLK